MRRVITSFGNNPIIKEGINGNVAKNVFGTVEFILIGTNYYSVILNDYLKLVKMGLTKRKN